VPLARRMASGPTTRHVGADALVGVSGAGQGAKEFCWAVPGPRPTPSSAFPERAREFCWAVPGPRDAFVGLSGAGRGRPARTKRARPTKLYWRSFAMEARIVSALG
jgi:hypothetical protein